MKTRIALMLLAASVAANAQVKEICETAELVRGKGWVYTEVPCSTIERPIPCTREWTDKKGRWHMETIPCPAGVKQKTVEQLAREEEAEKKRICGKDYRALRIGMMLDRFEQCYEALSFESDTVTAAGVVETWRSTFYWIHAQNDRIIGYTRRTR